MTSSVYEYIEYIYIKYKQKCYINNTYTNLISFVCTFHSFYFDLNTFHSFHPSKTENQSSFCKGKQVAW